MAIVHQIITPYSDIHVHYYPDSIMIKYIVLAVAETDSCHCLVMTKWTESVNVDKIL